MKKEQTERKKGAKANGPKQKTGNVPAVRPDPVAFAGEAEQLARLQAPQTSLVRINPQALISQAIGAKVSIEALEKLLAMRRELEAEYARKAYFEALAAFQEECPIIVKSSEAGSGSFVYRYASLDEIVRQVKGTLSRHGFSYTLKTKQNEKGFTVVCRVQHVDGHSEDTEITMPIDSGGRMNDSQKIGSANSYAKRYAFCNAFGIMTGDEDDDAQGTVTVSRPAKVAEPQPIAGVKVDAQGKILSAPKEDGTPPKPRTVAEIQADMRTVYEYMQQVLDGKGNLMKDLKGNPRTALPKEAGFPGGPFSRLFPDDQLDRLAKTATAEKDPVKLESMLADWRIALQDRYAEIGFELAGKKE